MLLLHLLLALQLLFPLLLLLQMVPDDTAADRADHGVMPGHMPSQPPGGRTGQAADRTGIARTQPNGQHHASRQHSDPRFVFCHEETLEKIP
jgi:hypothetical protein